MRWDHPSWEKERREGYPRHDLGHWEGLSEVCNCETIILSDNKDH